MSLMNMVTKVAIGFAIAKGVSAVQKSGGMGKMMDQLKSKAGSVGGTGGLLGGGAGAGGLGGIGGMLGGMAAARGGNTGSGQSLEDLLSRDAPQEEPPAEESAGLMIRAMVMAARCDGEIDANERETLMATIGEDATAEDMAFVRDAMDASVNARALADDTPDGLETQVYSMSVMAIEPDHPAEAQYLHELATALGIKEATVNEIHDSFNVPRLYS
ncbi:tellurite resistance TerB family protein [Litoreibacter sp.]|nr:tellurite resistance TerB family protein [Litoreibacter sp.]